ncbi:imelysin family protein [Thalassococcus sp. S3]|uniref:imelysin family protein n=1 Tax=Thalassococcus sp. S3 TaxID=2017482 RepID=UPI0010240357|nr:imelysin family protein [Thalassococcus sp. S3]QBF30469.1 imelysin peptidase [Thalassococcus sp. S3]
MRRLICAALMWLPLPVAAGTVETVDRHILPGYELFARAAQDLHLAGCNIDAAQVAYHATYDAWLGISHIAFGPAENRALAILFWPDPKDRTGRALAQLIADRDPIVEVGAEFDQVSVAARGLMAVERLLYDAADDATPYRCALLGAVTQDLSKTAAAILAAWQDGFADTLRTAGQTGNTRFRSEREGTQVLYTSLSTGLAFLHDQRLGRPLGTFDRPRPTRAEARRSGRSLRNVKASLTGLRDLAATLSAGDAPRTLAACEAALDRAERLDDPVFAGVADPVARLRVEALQRAVRDIQVAVATEIGASLGVSAGFNALDGD